MAKTSRQVQGDIYRLLRSSDMFPQLSGEVYRQGMRPRDSQLEDAVVIFTAGLADGDIETGVVTVNIFVPDIDPYSNGVFVENGVRTEQVERMAAGLGRQPDLRQVLLQVPAATDDLYGGGSRHPAAFCGRETRIRILR